MLCEWIQGGQLLHFLETEDHRHAANSLGLKTYLQDSPEGPGVKNPPANAGATGDIGSIPGWGRSPGRGHGASLWFLAGSRPPLSQGGLTSTPRGFSSSDRLAQILYVG